jgi:hypothetical protein
MEFIDDEDDDDIPYLIANISFPFKILQDGSIYTLRERTKINITESDKIQEDDTQEDHLQFDFIDYFSKVKNIKHNKIKDADSMLKPSTNDLMVSLEEILISQFSKDKGVSFNMSLKKKRGKKNMIYSIKNKKKPFDFVSIK